MTLRFVTHEDPVSPAGAETENKQNKMTESHSKSKLRRKKVSAKDVQVDMSSRGQHVQVDMSSRGPGRRSSLPSLTGGAKTERPALPAAAAWWKTLHPPAVESLWASTLMSALPYLENQLWDPVPDLPLPPAVKPTNWDQQRWCDLYSEVDPFPEPSLPNLKTPSSPDPQSLTSFQQDLPVQTKPAPEPPDRSPNLHTGSDGPPSRSLLLPVDKQGDEASSAASASGEQRWARGGEEARPVTQKVSVLPLPAEEEEQRVGGDEEAAALQSCPMCLQVFPVGSTQMDRDGHLAQCLSEMNMDMTW